MSGARPLLVRPSCRVSVFAPIVAAFLLCGGVGCGALPRSGPRLDVTVHPNDSVWENASLGAELYGGVALIGPMTTTSWIERVVCEVDGVSVEATLICATGGEELTVQAVSDLGATDWVVVSTRNENAPRTARIEKSSGDLSDAVVASIADAHGLWTDLNRATVAWPRPWAPATVAPAGEDGWPATGIWVSPECLVRFRSRPSPVPLAEGVEEPPTTGEYRLDRVVDGRWISTMTWREVSPGSFTVIGRDPEYRLEARRVHADGGGS